MKIDHIDRQILKKLQQDASLGLEDLGDAVGLSRNACWRRVKNLTDAKIIKSRVAILDAEKLNLGLTVFISVRTNQHDPDWLNKFASATRMMPEILGAYRSSGDWDYRILSQGSYMPAYDRFYQRLIKRIKLADVSARFVMEQIKETTALPL